MSAYAVELVNAAGEYQTVTLEYAKDAAEAGRNVAARTNGTRLLPGEQIGKVKRI